MVKYGLVETPLPELFSEIRGRLREGSRGWWRPRIRQRIAGFEDVVPGGLGRGTFYNTSQSISQLAISLALAPNEAIAEIVRQDKGSGTTKMVRSLREASVLEGFKVLDLGCGKKPGFAIAAKTLGAEVHTVDGEPIPSEFSGKIDSHTVVDLMSCRAIPDIAGDAGRDFDLVTDCILSNVPGHPRWRIPGQDDTAKLAEEFLGPEGSYAFVDGGVILRQRPD